MNLFTNKTTLLELQEKEVGVSRHLPFAYLEENDIVRTKSGDYLIVIKIEGISYDTLEDPDVNFEQNLRAKLFGSLSDPRFALYHTIIRKKLIIPVPEQPNAPFPNELIAVYNAELHNHDLFSNDLYLTILFKGSGSKGNRVISRINQWLTDLSHGFRKKQAQETHRGAIKTLHEMALRFTTSLAKYRVRRLALIPDTHGFFSEQLQFFSHLLNWDDKPLRAVESDISKYLPKRRLFFGPKGIESQGNRLHDSHFAAMVSLKEYPPTTYPGILDYLLELPVEMIITQSFTFQNRQVSREALELQLRRLHQSRDPDQKGIALLEQALGDLVAGEFGFGSHHLSVMVQATTLAKLEENVAEVEKRLSECGIVGIREGLNTEAAFWAQFPGNFRYIVRKMSITTDNFAGLCSLQNKPRGQKSGNHWGEAITLLKTSGNQPYYFNFHPPGSDVGHTLIVGATGSGKTLLTCFLIINTLKSNSRVFYFDKDHGAEAFKRALGADHCIIGHGRSTGFNPLQLPDSSGNRRFLADWLQSLLSATGDLLSSEDLQQIHQAVRLNYEQLQPHQRTLKNLAVAFGRGTPGSLRSRIDQWHSEGSLAEFFGSKTDQLRLDNRFFCFEMEHLLKKANDIARPAVLLYIFYRIQLALDENPAQMPTIICLDEAWALLDNPIFATNIRNWLKTFRKRNAIVILLSQEITDICKTPISASINAETVTKIFFPDPQPIKEIYRDVFHLAEREITLLQSYSGDQHYFLVKQPHESVFVNLDLTGLSKWIPVLSGNSATVKLLGKLLQQYGEDPIHWLPAYLEQAKYVKNN